MFEISMDHVVQIALAFLPPICTALVGVIWRLNSNLVKTNARLIIIATHLQGVLKQQTSDAAKLSEHEKRIMHLEIGALKHA